MKTKTVVELSHKELVDAVIASVKSHVKAGPGPVTVSFCEREMDDSHPKVLSQGVSASVTFEWTAKPNGG